LNLAVFFTPLYEIGMADPALWIRYGFASSLTIAMIIAVISIFLYENRSRQLLWVKLGTYIEIIGFAFGAGILFSLGGFGTFLWDETISLLLILTALGCYWLAGRNIKKDQELVRSMDRIR
ncbi:MAG: DUF4293 family protein, partial [Balneolaceae bacterium]|nr:DUF4293 family protein [Balneolaceae bacterium]